MDTPAWKFVAATTLIIMLITAPTVMAAPPFDEPLDVTVVNDPSAPVPVTVENQPTAPPLPFNASGEWEMAGAAGIPPMIVHDLTFFYDFDNTFNPPNTCRFTINYVIDQTTSRTLHRVELEPNESIEFHYQAGVDTENLRFGTILDINGNGNCVRNWAAFGFEKP